MSFSKLNDIIEHKLSHLAGGREYKYKGRIIKTYPRYDKIGAYVDTYSIGHEFRTHEEAIKIAKIKIDNG